MEETKKEQKSRLSKLKETAKELQRETRTRIITAITAGFAFVMALTWNDAIKGLVQTLIQSIGIDGTGYIYQIIAALITSFIAIIAIIILSKWSEKKHKEV